MMLLLCLIVSGCDRGEAAGGGLFSSGDGPTSSTLELAKKGLKRREFTVPVKTIEVVRGSVQAFVSSIGSIAPIETAPVLAEARGRITFVRQLQPDDPVQKGEILAHIDDEDLQAEIEIGRGEVENAHAAEKLSKSQLKQAEVDWETTRQLVSKELQPGRELDAAKMRVNTALNSMERAINAVRRAELDLERSLDKLDEYVVLAPMTGVLCPRGDIGREDGRGQIVNSREITDMDGQIVAPGSTLFGILDLTQVVARADVTSKDIAKIRIGSEAHCKIYMGEEDTEVTGEVIDISLVMNSETRAFQVDVLIDNPDARLRPGMFARLNIVTDIRRDSIAVPRRVMQRRNNQNVVFVVNERGYSVMRTITIGIENSEEIEVVEGLREGDLLVVMGQETLQDKVRVEIMNTLPSGEAAEL